MTQAIHNSARRVLAGVAALALVTGCASTAQNIESGADLAKAAGADAAPVVFGKLRLIRNGEPVEFGDGLMARTAAISLNEEGADRQFVGKIGEDGEFSWALPPGSYQVDSIAFRFHGQTIEPETNFTFTVSPDHDASYLGTITLEATFDSGYMGVHGAIDRFTVWDDCETDCERRLSQLGISERSATTSLFRWEGPR